MALSKSRATASASSDSRMLSGLTWLLVYKKQADAAKGKKLVGFLNWAYDQGQKEAAALDYAPLPAAIVKQVKARVAEIKS